jgi:sulfur relay (sulfurtransferase) complex TusBCD TusD component (DsrE family)
VSLLRVPKGTPINLIMNIHPKDLKAVVQAYVDGVLQGAPKEKFAELQPQNNAAALQLVQKKMLEVSLCPDFIEDRGHTFGRDLSDQDKQALIEYMKYF